jgi:hypothetical protein
MGVRKNEVGDIPEDIVFGNGGLDLEGGDLGEMVVGYERWEFSDCCFAGEDDGVCRVQNINSLGVAVTLLVKLIDR